MELQVLVERLNESLYRASALTLSAEGASEEEAITRLKGAFVQRLAAGAKVVTIPMPTVPAWLNHVSKLKEDDPFVQEYLAILREERSKEEPEDTP